MLWQAALLLIYLGTGCGNNRLADAGEGSEALVSTADGGIVRDPVPSELIFALTAPPHTILCGSAGAGVTGIKLTMNILPSGACDPLTFKIPPDNFVYLVNCASPQIAPCVASPMTFTGTANPGQRVVHVIGLIGPEPCWTADETVSVPSGSTLLHTVALTLGKCTGAPP